MEEPEYQRMAEVDDRMWWYRGLHSHVLAMLRRHLPQGGKPPIILDAGCGTGGLLMAMRRAFPEAELQGLELHPGAAAIARKRALVPVMQGGVQALPFPDASIDAITCTDVLTHRDLDPGLALGEFARVLRPGGVLVSNEAAFNWLRSYHDDRVQMGRRFTRASMRALLAAHPLNEVYSTHWNFFLLPVAWIKRKLLKPKPGESDVHEYPAWQDRFFGGLVALENAAMRAGLRWPCGVSLLTVARRSP